VAQVRWAARARDELQAIHDYVAADSPEVAVELVDRLLLATDRLADFPVSGASLPGLEELPHRQILVGVYRVIYRYDDDVVMISAVVHGHRDLPPLLPDDA
jgi:plasmid stabilization system protein ParE